MTSFLSAFQRPLCLAALLGGLALTGCKDDDDKTATPNPPAVVAFTQANLYPEGVQFDAENGHFLVSSQTTGAIGRVTDAGVYAVFADNPALVSTIGLHVDESRGRVLAAVSDPGYNLARTNAATQRKMALLAVFDRDNPSFAPLLLDLASASPATYANHFANDVAVDAQGNAYVTDSFAPLIYKVNYQTSEVTVLLENSALAAPAGAFGLNGIVYHPDGYLLVAKSDVGAIYKVPLNNPAGLTQVAIGQDLRGADGLLLADNNTLQVVCNAQARVYRLRTSNGWAAATADGTFSTPPQYPTTLARRAGAEEGSYVLYSNLNALQVNQQPPVSQFTIAEVDF